MGLLHTFSNRPANALYRVTEGEASNPVTITPVSLGAVPPLPAPQPGNECGVPVYQASIHKGVFLYKENCPTTTWRLRVAAGGVTTNVKFQGTLDADRIVAPFNLESGDTPSPTATYPIFPTAPFAFTLNTSWSNIDGFNFVPNGNGCLTLNLPTGVPVMVGPDRKVAPMPFNLNTFGACN